MRDFNPALENLMKFTPSSDAIRVTPPSSYTAHNSWFEVNQVDGASKKSARTKRAKL